MGAKFPGEAQGIRVLLVAGENAFDDLLDVERVRQRREMMWLATGESCHAFELSLKGQRPGLLLGQGI